MQQCLSLSIVTKYLNKINKFKTTDRVGWEAISSLRRSYYTFFSIPFVVTCGQYESITDEDDSEDISEEENKEEHELIDLEADEGKHERRAILSEGNN